MDMATIMVMRPGSYKISLHLPNKAQHKIWINLIGRAFSDKIKFIRNCNCFKILLAMGQGQVMALILDTRYTSPI